MNKVKTAIENLASRLAAAYRGRVAPADLLPHLPISLDMAVQYLEEMTDGSVVIESEVDGLRYFEFPEFLDGEPISIEREDCLVCHEKASGDTAAQLCSSCSDIFSEELYSLAEATAWPAEAVGDHEIVFITAAARGPISVASVSGKSRLTLKQLKERLKDLARRKFARPIIDEVHGVLTYEFPKVPYTKIAFEKNDRFIRAHPSSLKEEVEVKLIRSLTAIAVILASCIVLGLFRVPYPFLLAGGFVAASLICLRVFSKKSRVSPEQI